MKLVARHMVLPGVENDDAIFCHVRHMVLPSIENDNAIFCQVHKVI